MYSKEQLTAKAEKMQAYLQENPGTEPNDLINRLTKLNILLSQSGQCLADAKYHQDIIVNGAIMEAVQKAYEQKLGQSVINKFVTTAAKDFNYLVNLFDRINSSAVHQIDSLRSILSYRKSEMVL